MSTGETSLPTLLKSISPLLHPDTYTFIHLPLSSHAIPPASLLQVADLLFRETEGWTVILPLPTARRLGYTNGGFDSKKITLQVNSSLDAVGFLAVITTRLAGRVGVGVNPVSGYFHDHLFVPVGKEEQVMEELRLLAEEQGA